jgi:predicted alpha/beta superfamily hydrolase
VSSGSGSFGFIKSFMQVTVTLKNATFDWHQATNEINSAHMIGRFTVFAVVLVGMAWACETQFAFANQEPPHCSVVGDLDVRPFTSRVFRNTRMLRVWLPPGYKSPDQRTKRYPVMYLNDGQDLFDACTSIFNAQEWRVDETATALIQSGKIPELIIVGIDNAGKRDRPKEYLPFPDDTLKPPVLSVRGKEYPKFLLDEVMPFINREYRTDPDPAKTGLGGSSYGAGIALYTVMKHPGRFGKLLLESPSLYAHDNFLLHEADRFARWPEKVFIGVGSISEPVDDVHRLQDTLRRQGLGIPRLLVVEQPEAAHNEEAWAQRFPRALQFLYTRPPNQ